ncbi:MAG: hypothetical protein AB7L13_24555 [Acidimicrobiia bacterium]
MTAADEYESEQLTGYLFRFGYGMEPGDGDAQIQMTASINDHLRVSGTGYVRTSVLFLLADVAQGIPCCIASFPTVSVTVDLDVRTFGPLTGDEIHAVHDVVKAGRSLVIAESAFTDPLTGELVATAVGTFMVSPRGEKLPGKPARRRDATATTVDKPYPEYVGVRVIEPGVVEVDRRPRLLQTSNSLQGGVIALLGEVAAESMSGEMAVEIDVRYLGSVKVGPARTSTRQVGPHTYRVEIKDVGAGDRVTGLVLVRTLPTP